METPQQMFAQQKYTSNFKFAMFVIKKYTFVVNIKILIKNKF